MFSYDDILSIHKKAIETSGGSYGVLSESAILSAIGQPYQSFGGNDLYEGPIAKAAALGYFLVRAYGFRDGNKRVGFLALVTLLAAEGYHIVTTPDDGESMILAIAAGKAELDEFTNWVEDHIQPME